MIERFNFYDLYGYLIPGIVLLALLWLPFGLADQAFLKLDFSSAIFALVFGYVAGHLLQGLALTAFPSDRPRFPSDFLLDEDDPTFSPDLKARLREKIKAEFGIDVGRTAGADAGVLKRCRQDAFMLCRRSLVQKEVASYAEQFEGMYALMRGVAAACILAIGYNLGFLTQILGPSSVSSSRKFLIGLLFLLLIAALIGAVITNLEPNTAARWEGLSRRGLFWLTSFILYLFGTLSEEKVAEAFRSWVFVVGLCLVLGFVSARSFGAYRRFSRHFAETVYRDFCAR